MESSFTLPNFHSCIPEWPHSLGLPFGLSRQKRVTSEKLSLSIHSHLDIWPKLSDISVTVKLPVILLCSGNSSSIHRALLSLFWSDQPFEVQSFPINKFIVLLLFQATSSRFSTIILFYFPQKPFETYFKAFHCCVPSRLRVLYSRFGRSG